MTTTTPERDQRATEDLADVVDGLRDVANDLAQIADLLATAVERVCDLLPDDDEPEPPTDGPTLLRAATARTRAEGDARRAWEEARLDAAVHIADAFDVPVSALTAPTVSDIVQADADEAWERLKAHAAVLTDRLSAPVRSPRIAGTAPDHGSRWQGATVDRAVLDEAPFDVLAVITADVQRAHDDAARRAEETWRSLAQRAATGLPHTYQWQNNAIATVAEPAYQLEAVRPFSFVAYEQARQYVAQLWSAWDVDGTPLAALCRTPTVQHDGTPTSWARVPACGTPTSDERPTVATLARAAARPVRFRQHWWRPRRATWFAPAHDEPTRPLADRLPFATEPAHDLHLVVRPDSIRQAFNLTPLRRALRIAVSQPYRPEPVVVGPAEYERLREATVHTDAPRTVLANALGIPIRADDSVPAGVVYIDPTPTRADWLASLAAHARDPYISIRNAAL